MKKLLLLILFLLLALPVHATTFDAAVDSGLNPSSNTTFTGPSMTVNSGDTLAVFMVWNNTGSTNNMSLTCAGFGTPIKYGSIETTSGAGNVQLFYIPSPTAASNTCTETATTSTRMAFEMSTYEGTNTTTAVADGTAGVVCGTAVSSCSLNVGTYTSGSTGDWVFVGGPNASGAPTAAANTTIRVSNANGWGSGDSNASIAAGTNVGMAFSPSSTFALSAMAILSAPPAVNGESKTTVNGIKLLIQGVKAIFN